MWKMYKRIKKFSTFFFSVIVSASLSCHDIFLRHITYCVLIKISELSLFVIFILIIIDNIKRKTFSTNILLSNIINPGSVWLFLTSGCFRRMWRFMEARVETFVPHRWQLWASTFSWVNCMCFCSIYCVTYFLSQTEQENVFPTAKERKMRVNILNCFTVIKPNSV